MNNEEMIRQEAVDDGAEVIDWKFMNDSIKGLYCDGVIAVGSSMPTSAERACILAEELGHHKTAAGNILDQRSTRNRKQELAGRIWAYDRLIGLAGILRAFRAGCRNRYEMAEYLGVTEEMLADAMVYYRRKYGTCARYGKYMIYLDPLGVMEMI